MDYIPTGLDFAPSSSGIVMGSAATALLYKVVVWNPNPDGVKASWRERRAAANLVVDTIDVRLGDLGDKPFVILEDYAPGRWSGTSHIEIAESRGFMLNRFVECGWPFVLIHPMRLKSFIGVKTKEATKVWAKLQMTLMECEPLPVGLTERQYGDLCDAFVLWAIGIRLLNDPEGLPKSWVEGESALNQPRNNYYEPFLEE